MYRPEIKVLDCTIRDGGLANDSHFSLEAVRAVYRACCDAHIDYVELGYRNSRAMFDPKKFGVWRFCDEADLRAATDGIQNDGTKIAVMMDAHKSDPNDILPKAESVVDTIRVATYVKDIDKAIAVENAAHEKGYETTINMMAISIESDWELDPALAQLEKETHAVACYVVDSFGALYSEQVDYFVEKYQRLMPSKEVGVHMHNNQQLGFANTIEGIIKGANFVDGTIYGLGRASGNCPLELLLGFLKNPKFNIRPVFDCVAQTILPMQKDLEWGYMVPYMVTGILNQHPRAAMAMLKAGNRNDYRTFYDKMLELVE
ncbi:MAG TPA: aldolase catalytic domain-containing protein [Phycisphaerae bacterium]|nr:aldolase catalytic domain-containing protein [Phycisphaerae bacterium]